MRRFVEGWKEAGAFLDQEKWDRLRAMTEEDAAREFETLRMHPRDGWMPPERMESSGLIEQQRIFSRCR